MPAATRFGPTLPDGGTVGVVSPASGFHNRSEILRGVEWWEARGYRVKLGPGVFDRDDYVAGDPKSRAEDLMAMFADPEVHVVQCLWGGFGSAQVLPHLDPETIARHPKAVVGYSDITALHVGLLQEAGLATVYGYGLMGTGSASTTEFTRSRLLQVLRGGGAGPVPANPDDPYLRAIRGGRATGPLAGGCLWLLMQGMGTPWEIELDGSIFFVEDHDEPPWVIDGILTQLSLAGKLAGVKGVVVSELANCEWTEARPEWPRTSSVEDVLERHLDPLGVPVLYGLPLGDGTHQAALPLGVPATLDADARTLSIDRPALVPASNVGPNVDQKDERDRTGRNGRGPGPAEGGGA